MTKSILYTLQTHDRVETQGIKGQSKWNVLLERSNKSSWFSCTFSYFDKKDSLPHFYLEENAKENDP